MITATLALLLQTAPASPAATSSVPAPEKKVCRTFAETGSFVRKVKTCRTRAEWRRIEEESRDEARARQTLISTERGG